MIFFLFLNKMPGVFKGSNCHVIHYSQSGTLLVLHLLTLSERRYVRLFGVNNRTSRPLEFVNLTIIANSNIH